MINRHWCISALDEDSPNTNSCLFTLDRLPLLLLLRKNQFSSSPNTSQQSVRKSLYSILLGLHYPVKIERSCHRAGTSGKYTVYTVQCTVLLCQYIKQSPVIRCHAGTSDCTVQSATMQVHQAAYSIQCYRSATPAVYSIQCYLAGTSISVQFHHASMLDNVHCDHADRSGNVL